MSDLISRQAAIDEANAWLLDCFKVQKQDRSCGLIRRLENLASADVAPVVHAYWFPYECMNDNYQDLTCSHCKHNFTVDAWKRCDIGFVEEDLEYCPHCGAKMDAPTPW